MVKHLKAYSTHIPTIIKMLNETDGAVIEFGSGFYSTPLLHWLCEERGRPLETYEGSREYYIFARQFGRGDVKHTVHFVEDWDSVVFRDHYSIAFIDHETERRSIDAMRMKDRADFIILHDTETYQTSDDYGYSKVFPHFKYVYHWTKERPHTSVISNLREICNSQL